MSSIVQSVMFNFNRWSVIKAAQWLQDHDFKVKKLDITENYLRFRQVSPTSLKKKGFTQYITKRIKNDIELIIALKPNQEIKSNLR